MLNSEHTMKMIATILLKVNFAHSIGGSYHIIYLMRGSYDRFWHVMIMDLILVQFYSNARVIVVVIIIIIFSSIKLFLPSFSFLWASLLYHNIFQSECS